MSTESIFIKGKKSTIAVYFDGSILSITQQVGDELQSIALIEDDQLNINEFQQVIDAFQQLKSNIVNQRLLTREEIYEYVSTYYKNRGFEKDEFTNRLRSIGLMFEKDYTLTEAAREVVHIEHGSQYAFGTKDEYQKIVSHIKYDLGKCLKTMGYKHTRKGLVPLEE